MSKIPMVSHARHLYNGRQLASGDSFSADSEDDAKELEIIGFAKRKPQVYATRVMTADTSAAPVASASAGASAPAADVADPNKADPAVKPRRPYMRRDMGASGK